MNPIECKLPLKMTENEAATQRKFLERLIVANPDLERLESLIKKFNLFVAMGVVRHEVRH